MHWLPTYATHTAAFLLGFLICAMICAATKAR